MYFTVKNIELAAKAIVFALKQVAIEMEQVAVVTNAMINEVKHICFTTEPMFSVTKFLGFGGVLNQRNML